MNSFENIPNNLSLISVLKNGPQSCPGNKVFTTIENIGKMYESIMGECGIYKLYRIQKLNNERIDYLNKKSGILDIEWTDEELLILKKSSGENGTFLDVKGLLMKNIINKKLGDKGQLVIYEKKWYLDITKKPIRNLSTWSDMQGLAKEIIDLMKVFHGIPLLKLDICAYLSITDSGFRKGIHYSRGKTDLGIIIKKVEGKTGPMYVLHDELGDFYNLDRNSRDTILDKTLSYLIENQGTFFSLRSLLEGFGISKKLLEKGIDSVLMKQIEGGLYEYNQTKLIAGNKRFVFHENERGEVMIATKEYMEENILKNDTSNQEKEKLSFHQIRTLYAEKILGKKEEFLKSVTKEDFIGVDNDISFIKGNSIQLMDDQYILFLLFLNFKEREFSIENIFDTLIDKGNFLDEEENFTKFFKKIYKELNGLLGNNGGSKYEIKEKLDKYIMEGK